MGSKTTSSWRLGSSKKVVSESAALSLVVDVSLKGKTGKGFEALDLGVRLLGSGCWLRTENRFVRMDSEENEEREVAETRKGAEMAMLVVEESCLLMKTQESG